MTRSALTAGRPVVVDAGALTEIVAWKMLDLDGVPSGRGLSILQDIHGKAPKPSLDAFERLWATFAAAPVRFAPPTVLQEAWRARVQRTLRLDAPTFYARLERFSAEFELSEIYVPLSELWREAGLRDAVIDLGLTDAAVLRLAVALDADLLTEDQRLSRYAAARQVRCIGASIG